MTLISKNLLAGLALGLFFGAANVSDAALLVYEPFDYQAGAQLWDPGTTTGLNGGGGFGQAWQPRENNAGRHPNGASAIQAASLVGPAGLPTSGGHAVITGEFGTAELARTFSDFARAKINSASTLWISFLAQRQGATTDPLVTDLPNNPYPRGTNISFHNPAQNDEKFGIGNSSNATDNTWSIIPDGAGNRREGAYDPAGGVAGGGPDTVGAATFPWNDLHWAVARIDVATQDIRLWLSPDPNVEPVDADADITILGTDTNWSTPSVIANPLMDIATIRPFVGNNAGTAGAANFRPFGVLALDEFRVGTTYGAMSSTTVLPEPSSLLMLLLGSLGLVARRRTA